MKIKEVKEGDILVCSIEGEININTSPELRAFFDKTFRAGNKYIMIDFSRVSYIDSSGLATLVEMLQRVQKIGGKLKLCNMGLPVRNVFEVTKLDSIFDIHQNCDQAKRSFGL